MEKLASPQIIAKLIKPMGKRILQVASGIGMVIMAAEAAYYFYQGYDKAEEIWQPQKDEEMTIIKKALCGIINALNEIICLSIFFDTKEIVAFLKSIPGVLSGEDQKKEESTLEDSGGAIQSMKNAAKNAWNKSLEMIESGWSKIKSSASDLVSGAKEAFNTFK